MGKVLGACAAPPLLAEAAGAQALAPGMVVVVGRIGLVPALQAGEQDVKVPIDIAGFAGAHRGRAMLRLGPTPGAREQALINPPLQAIFCLAVPRALRYMVGGAVPMFHNGRYGIELPIPGPLEWASTPGDDAIYVGTLRLHRDEFNQVNRAAVIDEWPAAQREFARRFGSSATPHKALARAPLARVA